MRAFYRIPRAYFTFDMLPVTYKYTHMCVRFFIYNTEKNEESQGITNKSISGFVYVHIKSVQIVALDSWRLGLSLTSVDTVILFWRSISTQMESTYPIFAVPRIGSGGTYGSNNSSLQRSSCLLINGLCSVFLNKILRANRKHKLKKIQHSVGKNPLQ